MKHIHQWVQSFDWDWGPGTIVFECSCRGLRVVRKR